MKLKLIPAGESAMGSDDSDPNAEIDEKSNGEKHRVRITKPSCLGETEVTCGQFRRFVKATNYETQAERNGQGARGWDEAKRTIRDDPRFTMAITRIRARR